MRFCTYILLDPRRSGRWILYDNVLDFEPFYVGKGLRLRPYQHIKPWELRNKSLKSSKVKAILRKSLSPIVYIYKQNISDEEATRCEIELIKYFGRKNINTGILTNLTDGGEGHTGFKQPIEVVNKRMAHIRGRKKSREVVERMVNGRLQRSGFRMSESTKEKLRRVKLTEERKQHLRELRKLQVISREAYERAAISRYKKILQYDLEGNFVREWESLKSATNFFNKGRSRISDVLSNKRKAFAGYQWKYWSNNYPLKIEKYKHLRERKEK